KPACGMILAELHDLRWPTLRGDDGPDALGRLPKRLVEQVRGPRRRPRLRVPEERAYHGQREAPAGQPACVAVPEVVHAHADDASPLAELSPGLLYALPATRATAPREHEGSLPLQVDQELERRRRQRDRVLGLLLRGRARLGPGARLEVD